MNEEQIRQIIREEISDALQSLIANERYTFQKHLQIFDGRNVQLGRGVGTNLGTAADQKLGFYGKTPIIQSGAISAPAGGGTAFTDAIDISARSAINSIRTVLTNTGLTA